MLISIHIIPCCELTSTAHHVTSLGPNPRGKGTFPDPRMDQNRRGFYKGAIRVHNRKCLDKTGYEPDRQVHLDTIAYQYAVPC